ncbi:MAG TPA: cytochrome P450 [Rubrobacteraceae bacterium]|jgi:cytochrome P450|nr:cytochrome P450 [Rubrobacteraceae bacterium]HEV8224783.1 cytochrome P450 [Rubrobacteraceae bacterium]
MSQPPRVDLFDPSFKADPYPTYAKLRSSAPVYRAALPDGRGVWLITRYDDVLAVLKDQRFVKDWRGALTPEQLAQVPPIPEVMKPLSQNMLDTDPPDHERLRALVSKAFTPRLIERLRPRVQAISDGLLDAVQDRGEMDLIDDYAFPLPITVIAELLGVPAEDRNNFREWSDAAVSGNASQEYMEQILIPHMQAFTDYLRALFEEKRSNPKDDLVSALVRAEEAGDRLSEDELLGMVFLLLVAGHETTVNLIGNGVLALLQHPDQLRKLKEDPSLIKPAVEELLRYDGPVETSTERFAREDVEIGGQVIPRGEMVLVVLAAADHDPERFPDPDELDITRTDNRHLAFGKGIHHCLGAPLARMEGQIAISTLLRRMPNLRLKGSPESLSWRPGMILRGLRGLPVEF